MSRKVEVRRKVGRPRIYTKRMGPVMGMRLPTAAWKCLEERAEKEGRLPVEVAREILIKALMPCTDVPELR